MIQKQILIWASAVTLIWRALIELLHLIIVNTPLVTIVPSQYVSHWSRWGGGWYLDIVLNGYHQIPVAQAGGQANFAFFPTFPFFTRGVDYLIPGSTPVFAGLLMNTAITIFVIYFMVLIGQLIAQKAGVKNPLKSAKLAAVLLLAYPSSFFLVAFYAEALLLLGVFGAIYFAMKDKYILAGLFAAIATATKSLGSAALVAGFCILTQQYIEKKGKQGWLKNLVSVGYFKRLFAFGAIGVSGIVLYMVYLQVRFGDALLFYRVQSAWGRGDNGFFVVNLLKVYYAHIFQPSYFGTSFGYLFNLFLMALPFALILLAYIAAKKYRLYWLAVLVLYVIFLPLSTGITQSFNRYALVAAPVLIVIPLLLERRPRVLAVIVIASSVTLATCCAFFLGGTQFSG